MPSSTTLKSITAAIAQNLEPALICQENLSQILSIANLLPHWKCMGFECRLGNPEPFADFGVHLTQADLIATDFSLAETATSADTASNQVWKGLHQLANAWADPASLVSQTVPAISLEFDVHKTSHTLAPSIFFSIHPGSCGPEALYLEESVETCSRVVQAILEIFSVDLSDDVQNQLKECYKTLLPKVSFLQFGVWLARSTDTFRICAPGISLVEIKPILTTLKWCGPTDAYEAYTHELLKFGNQCSIHIDIGKVVLAKLGIEILFDDSSAYMDQEDLQSTRFFNYLVAEGLCLPEKCNAIFSWTGGFRLKHNLTDFYEDQSIFLRRVSHVKMVYDLDQAPQAKVYLSVGQVPQSERKSGNRKNIAIL